MGTKKPWYSKTIWLGVATAVAPFVPGMAEFIQAHVLEVSVIWGILAAALRLFTKDSVSLVD